MVMEICVATVSDKGKKERTAFDIVSNISPHKRKLITSLSVVGRVPNLNPAHLTCAYVMAWQNPSNISVGFQWKTFMIGGFTGFNPYQGR